MQTDAAFQAASVCFELNTLVVVEINVVINKQDAHARKSWVYADGCTP